MKLQTYFLLFTGLFLLFSCGNKETDSQEEIIEDVVIDEIQNLSDIHFEEALLSFKGNKMREAATHIREGATALQKEAADTTRSVNKDALEKSVSELNQLAADIQADKVRDTDLLREAFANAALTVSHDYLVFDDVFILEKPEKVNSTKLNKSFDKTEKSFNSIKKSLSESAKKEADKIADETQMLKKEKDELDKKIKNQMNRIHSFVKTHKPEKQKDFPYYEFE